MTLKESKPYLRSGTDVTRIAALWLYTKTSSVFEGFPAPFNPIASGSALATPKSFTAYWQARSALTA